MAAESQSNGWVQGRSFLNTGCEKGIVLLLITRLASSMSGDSGEGPYYVGIDVGSASVRAALVTKHGIIVSNAAQPIKIMEPEVGFYEQSSDDIWEAVCRTVKLILEDFDGELVQGIGFDATCSLVVLNGKEQPLSVSPTDEDCWNVIMWMDHRAKDQAVEINKTGHKVLQYVGGGVSLEMQTPKLLWLKENKKSECWDKAGHFFDLPDYLTWKATGSKSRSLCSLVCKWTYMADDKGMRNWDSSFFSQIGLDDLEQDGFAKIGCEVLAPGVPCGNGLSQAAALELGLRPGIPVGASIIDAHAGGLGCLGCQPSRADLATSAVESRMALIAGTSSCHMAVSKSPLFVPGVWGPYYSAMVPGLWLNEGGQSACGKLLNHLIENHVSYPIVKGDAEHRNCHDTDILNGIVHFMSENVNHEAELTKDLHVWPDYHGNRSPLADPSLKGMVSGLSLDNTVEDLAKLYLAAVQALAYGTRHIIESLEKAGHSIKVLHICGGLCHNDLFVQTHADVLGLPIVLPDTSESVLVGAAVLGALASGGFQSVEEAMSSMGGKGSVVSPNEATKQYHTKKYSVFKSMLEHQRQYQELMQDT